VKEFNPAQAILISADSIAELRRCDVFRVLEWTAAEHRAAVAEYVSRNRPELAGEVLAVLTELLTD
jgi:hypothetical protein